MQVRLASFFALELKLRLVFMQKDGCSCGTPLLNSHTKHSEKKVVPNIGFLQLTVTTLFLQPAQFVQ